KTKTQLDDIFVQSADFPLTLLIFASGGAVVERMIPLATNNDLTTYFIVGFKAVSVVACVLFFDKFLNALIHTYSGKVEILKTSGGVARGFVRIIVIGLGLLILLDSFGVSITPVLASLGVGSLAVALALQPTLENFFSGIQLIMDKPIKVGHFVKLDSGEEGYVHKIGWRSTWVKMLPNNVVVIPNKVIVNAKVVNYYYPQKELAVLVQVGVHYESDLEYVERVTMEVGKETLKEVEGGVEDFDPFIRYHTFGDFSINFSVILRAKEFVDNYLIKHEFIKRLHKRYAQEGIKIPYPIWAINYSQEKAPEGLTKA
ncbi:MAG: mechanosensitive ion channel family protein, partial [Candidatus Omnitrophica bacterium]|nr:mechanosensitive ion channel family protein [Candidatus Omnitrophota bacterium]